MELLRSSSSEDVIVVWKFEKLVVVVYDLRKKVVWSWLTNDYIQNLTFKSLSNLYNEL